MKKLVVLLLLIMCCVLGCGGYVQQGNTDQAGLGLGWWSGYNPYDTYLYHNILGHEIITCVN